MTFSMSNSVCSIWQSTSTENTTAIVVPDGCRDLICKCTGNGESNWLVSPLFEHAEMINVVSGTNHTGFRLKPGVRISESDILAVLKSENIELENVNNLLDDFTYLNSHVEEALSCLSSDVSSVKEASDKLGVGIRTLQRLIVKETAKSPSYWFQLARVRRAARELTKTTPFAEVADSCGFSDQSHMNREIRRWFTVSPSDLAKSSDIAAQLNEPGYD